MQEVFIGREKELADLEELYLQERFQLFVLYGRRRVGKTTLLNEFCKDKDAIFYSAEQSNNKLNLENSHRLYFSFMRKTTWNHFRRGVMRCLTLMKGRVTKNWYWLSMSFLTL